ncbi:hypothetical protein D3C71_1537140 [compost metagenome]
MLGKKARQMGADTRLAGVIGYDIRIDAARCRVGLIWLIEENGSSANRIVAE